MKSIGRIIVFILLILAVQAVQARDNVSFETVMLDVDAHAVYSVFQDSEGMIWAGTNEGLYNYDGYSLHKHYDKETPGNSHIYSIIEWDGNLFLGADSGLLLFDLGKDVYRELPNIGFPKDVRTLAIDMEDHLWIGSLNGLYCYDLRNTTLDHIEKGIPHKAIYDIVVMSYGDIYVATYDGLALKPAKDNEFHEISYISQQRKGKNIFVNSLLEDSFGGCLWVGTSGNLYRYSLSEQSFEVIRNLHDNTIKSMTCNGKGSLYLGTDDGLIIMEHGKSRHLRHDSRDPKSLINNVIWKVFLDRDENLWAGTESDISVLLENVWFETYPLSQFTSRGDGNVIYRIFRDSKSNLWLGGTNGIIRLKNGLSSGKAEWYMMGDRNHHLSHNRVRDIYEDSHGDLWLATDGSINRYDYSKGGFINYTLKDSTGRYNVNWDYSIIEDKYGNMWTGGYLGGILVIERDKLIHGVSIADRAYNTSNGLPTNYLNMLIEDRDGNKWALLYQSGMLIKIAEEDGKVYRYDFWGQVGRTPYYILADDCGYIWCGFQGGVAKVDYGGEVTDIYRLPDSEVNVTSMAQIGGNIWISTAYGVWSLDMGSGEMKVLPLPDAAWTCIYNDVISGDVLLGGVDEIMRVNPSISSYESDRNGLVITDIYINDVRRNLPEAESVRRMESMEFRHDENNVSLSFSDLDYHLNNRPQFAWRLNDGRAESKWSYLPKGTNRISMANLDDGEYVLEIKKTGAYDDTGVHSFPIRIKPAWYDSLAAKFIYAVLFVMLMFGICRYIRERNRLKIEMLEREKTLESINNRIEFLTNVSHEFKTPLSMIIGPLSRMLQDVRDKEQRSQLESVYKNAMGLNSLIHRALETNRMDAESENLLIYSQVDFVEFCRSIFDNYRENVQGKNLIFTTDFRRLRTEVDVVKMESVINNILSNACKYTGDNATIAFYLTLVEGRIIIRISDDGVGIPEGERPLVFQRLYQSTRTIGEKKGSGIGLYLTKEFIEMHGGTIGVESNSCDGTVFTIVLPLREPVMDNDDEETMTDDIRQTVLIVEDNIAIAKFIKDILREEYRCIISTNGRAGLAVCGSVTPDLIIADVMMPVMDGVEMCRRIKRNPRLAAIPMIMLTAKDDKLTETESIRSGVDVFMPKPFETPLLTARVHQLLEAKDIIRRNIRIEEITEAKTIEAESPDERMLAEITGIIEDNLTNPNLNVTFVCEKSGLSSKQLYRLLKKYIGVSPVDHIRQIRMKKAGMLLQQNKFTVAEVMYMVGFSSSSYFAKCFQAHFDCTPSQYVEKNSL